MDSFEEIKAFTQSSFNQGMLTAAAIIRMQNRMARDEYSTGFNSALEHAATQLETIVKMSEETLARQTVHPGVGPEKPQPAPSSNRLRCSYCLRDSCQASYRGGHCSEVSEDSFGDLSDRADGVALEPLKRGMSMELDADTGEAPDAESETRSGKELSENEKGSG